MTFDPDAFLRASEEQRRNSEAFMLRASLRSRELFGIALTALLDAEAQRLSDGDIIQSLGSTGLQSSILELNQRYVAGDNPTSYEDDATAPAQNALARLSNAMSWYVIAGNANDERIEKEIVEVFEALKSSDEDISVWLTAMRTLLPEVDILGDETVPIDVVQQKIADKAVAIAKIEAELARTFSLSKSVFQDAVDEAFSGQEHDAIEALRFSCAYSFANNIEAILKTGTIPDIVLQNRPVGISPDKYQQIINRAVEFYLEQKDR